MSKPFKAKEHIRALNDLRRKYSESGNCTFAEEEFREDLKKCGIPSNPVFWSELKKTGIIVKIQDNLYAFAEPERPIHFSVLQNIHANYTNRLKQYEKTRKDKALSNKTAEKTDVQAAIELLKSKGFEIYTPVGILYSRVE